MALTNTDRKVIHTGNGSATVFPYGFPILDTAHLSVIYTDAAGAETTLSPSLYTVTGIGALAGGSVTYPKSGSAISSGTKLTIVRTVTYTQTTVLSNQGGYYPEVVERRFDEVYMALQQMAEVLSRTVVGSISDPATEQTNYELIQALQQMNLLTTNGDLLTRIGGAYARLARGSAGQYLGVTGGGVLEWQTLGLEQSWETGDYRITSRASTALTGWVKVDDGTIGNAASGATTRANADTVNLFTHLYTTFGNSICPVSGGRGANAAADFAANKTITLSAMLGRALVVAGAGSGLTSRALGDKVGAETHTHTGTTDNNSGTLGVDGGGFQSAPHPHTHTFTTAAGSSMQPSTFVNVFMKL